MVRARGPFRSRGVLRSGPRGMRRSGNHKQYASGRGNLSLLGRGSGHLLRQLEPKLHPGKLI
ncbi:MAG TPA: hypothetical protein VHM88_25940 [Candidatus Acidoferrales bacterium]|nr:hypothetical protein [Candidatus Acidoferrales bacterium]